MIRFRSAMTALIASAVVAGAAAPAAAYPRYYRGYHHYHHGGGATGALLGGLLIGGAAVAVANSVDNDRGTRVERIYDDPTPPPPPPPAPAQYGETQGVAVDQCSEAAERDSSPNAHVNSITRVDREANGWRVDGVIDTGRQRIDGYRDIGQFTCAVDGGRVVDLRFGEQPYAQR